MHKLSTGMDSTLENWILMSRYVFGEDSNATKFLKQKAEKSPNGVKEEVLADEAQLIQVLILLHSGNVPLEGS